MSSGSYLRTTRLRDPIFTYGIGRLRKCFTVMPSFVAARSGVIRSIYLSTFAQ